MNKIETIFIVITGTATFIMAIPVIQKKWMDFRVWRWKRKMKPQEGECEDDNKNIYVAKKAIEYFHPRYDTHEVLGVISVEAENENRKEGEKLNSNGDIITIEFERFKKFVKELMKDYKEDSYVEWLTNFDPCQRANFSYSDRSSDVLYIYFDYSQERFGENERKAVNLYTEPVKIEGVLDMRPLRI